MGVFSRDDLTVFTIPTSNERIQAFKDVIAPKLSALSKGLLDELAVRTGEEFCTNIAVHAKRKRPPPEETWLALGPTPRGYRKEPYFAVALSRNAVHVRVVVAEECPRKGHVGETIVERSPDLARHAQQLGALRSFEEWDFEGLPDPAPAAEALFWSTLGNRIASKKSARLDIGVGWKGAEALRLGKTRIAEAIARLMPLYHLVTFDLWRF